MATVAICSLSRVATAVCDGVGTAEAAGTVSLLVAVFAAAGSGAPTSAQTLLMVEERAVRWHVWSKWSIKTMFLCV